jgi:tetraacyldisaccharide 4'-kinase
LFTGIRYKDPTPIFQTHVESENVILLSGIANSQVFEANMSAKYKVLDSIIFKDHHQYTLRDVDLIKKKYADHSNKDLRIICTEKDMVKLIAFKEHFGTLPIYYIPIEVYFLKSNEKELFEQKILAYMESEII